MSAPLRSKSELLVAHGNHGGNVIKFTLEENELSDTGFLVLYLSTQYSDMTHVQQDSAFDAPGVEALVKRSAHPEKSGGLWGTALTIITVARDGVFRARPSAAHVAPRSSSLLYFVFYSAIVLVLVMLVVLLSYVFLAYGPFFA
jgi:hypothetical protein